MQRRSVWLQVFIEFHHIPTRMYISFKSVLVVYVYKAFIIKHDPLFCFLPHLCQTHTPTYTRSFLLSFYLSFYISPSLSDIHGKHEISEKLNCPLFSLWKWVYNSSESHVHRPPIPRLLGHPSSRSPNTYLYLCWNFLSTKSSALVWIHSPYLNSLSSLFTEHVLFFFLRERFIRWITGEIDICTVGSERSPVWASMAFWSYCWFFPFFFSSFLLFFSFLWRVQQFVFRKHQPINLLCKDVEKKQRAGEILAGYRDKPHFKVCVRVLFLSLYIYIYINSETWYWFLVGFSYTII